MSHHPVSGESSPTQRNRFYKSNVKHINSLFIHLVVKLIHNCWGSIPHWLHHCPSPFSSSVCRVRDCSAFGSPATDMSISRWSDETPRRREFPKKIYDQVIVWIRRCSMFPPQHSTLSSRSPTIRSKSFKNAFSGSTPQPERGIWRMTVRVRGTLWPEKKVV